jgi:Ca2+/Na+ antiporter
MGVTVLAIGTSIPDALGSIFSAKQGYAGMAVSNAIGSNVFDILIGLGVPWLIFSSYAGPVLVCGVY